MALRSTYSTGLFSSGAYGVPETTQAAATASIALSASASAVTIVEASCSASVGFVASNPTAVRVVNAAASISLGGIANVSAVKYEVISGFRAGYGLNTYGSYLYGKNISIEEGRASANIGVSASCSAVAVRQSDVVADVSIAATAQGFMSIVGSVSDTISITPQISYNRVRLMSASDDIDITAQVFARYKWINAPEPTTSWTEADYLERAA